MNDKLENQRESGDKLQFILDRLHNQPHCQARLRLFDYHHGHLSPREDRLMVRHLEGCASCRLELTVLAGAPRLQKTRVKARPLPGYSQPSAMPVLGFRRALNERDPNHVYEAGQTNIVLQWLGDAMIGQVWDENQVGGGRVQLSQSEAIVAETEINQAGNFKFEAVPQGEYQLLVRLDACEIEIECLEIS